MVSSSDSESDSDDCLVYKTTRNVVWSDDEDEKQNAGGIGRDRDDDDEVCATSSSRKRARVTTGYTTSTIEVVELGEDAHAAARTSAAASFLAPPPSAPAIQTQYDVKSLHSKLSSASAMAELRRAATAPVVAPIIAPTFTVAKLSVAGTTGGGVGAGGTSNGKKLHIVLQPAKGQRVRCSCFESDSFSKTLETFFATDGGASLRLKLENPPKLNFDGELVSMGATPKDLDMDDDDVVDIR